MNTESHQGQNRDDLTTRARDTHLKFAFYTVALVFTTTAASIQTVKPRDISVYVLALEVAGW